MKFFALFCALTFPTSLSLASSPGTKFQEIESFLKEFHQNTAEVMDQLPQEVDSDGHARSRGKIDYKGLATSGNFQERIKVRSRIMRSSHQSEDAIPEDGDKAEILVDGGNVERNIFQLAGKTIASAPVTPWSDSYWPIYKGLVATRYADPNFPNSKIWVDNFDYAESHPASEIAASGSAFDISLLSPAEKYDLLVGDSSWSLTHYAWNEGRDRFEKEGSVSFWEGICHGWSGASHMNAPTANHPVDAIGPGGQNIRFYPGDLRALTSLLWANASPSTRFVGSRCTVVNPAKDRNGRILDKGCFDTNPSTFHLALINQLGMKQRSFVMDATYDAQIWNFPIMTYNMTYFNPQDLRPRSNVAQAIIPIEQFTVDKFKTYRSPDTRFVAGVTLDVTYAIEIGAIQGTHSPVFKTERYFYDLELNAQKEVIGGEWYTNAHPDFIWTYDASAKAKTLADTMIDPGTHWEPNTVLPESWMNLAHSSSTRGQPMSAIVNVLVEAGH